ncbi:MAG TPA: tetratricopeptide repeat-containing glycosyltransferase family protein, partial [Pirellulales bacterium]
PLGRLNEAVSSLERAVALDAEGFTAIMRLAALRTRLGELELAAELLRRAVELRPADAGVLNMLGVVLGRLGSMDDALDCLDDAVQFAPDFAEAHLNRAYALLRAGRFVEGWVEFEWRNKRGQENRARKESVLGTQSVPYAVWDGSSLAEKTILIAGEQELADEVMFASCYRDGIERAKQCVIACDPRLERMMRRSFPRACVVGVPRGRQPQLKLPDGQRIDLQIMSASLPRFLRPTAESFPNQSHYLSAEPTAVEACRSEYAKLGAGPKIGIGTSGGQTDVSPASQLTKAFKSLPGATIITLAGEANSLDIDDLSSRLAALDLVVCDGGLIAHLAGALGVPCWILLADETDWRWIGTETTTLWYPKVRLFRERRLKRNADRRTQNEKMKGSLSEAVERLSAELLNWIAQNADKKRMTPVRVPHFVPLPIGQTSPPIGAPPLLS